MSDKCIVMFNIDDGRSQHNPHQYTDITKMSWESFCKKHNIDFIHITEPVKDVPHSKWNKHFVFDFIDTKYKKIGMVDFDTMPNMNAPNIFDLYDDEFCGVVDNESIGWLYNSISKYKEAFEDLSYNTEFMIDKYINSGVLFFTRSHKFIFDAVIDFYYKNKESLDNWDVPNTGRDQTVLNLILEHPCIKDKFKRKYFDVRFNTMRLRQNGWLSHNWQLNEDSTNFFIKYSFIWHFTGCSVEERSTLINQVWKGLKNNYER